MLIFLSLSFAQSSWWLLLMVFFKLQTYFYDVLLYSNNLRNLSHIAFMSRFFFNEWLYSSIDFVFDCDTLYYLLFLFIYVEGNKNKIKCKNDNCILPHREMIWYGSTILNWNLYYSYEYNKYDESMHIDVV